MFYFSLSHVRHTHYTVHVLSFLAGGVHIMQHTYFSFSFGRCTHYTVDDFCFAFLETYTLRITCSFCFSSGEAYTLGCTFFFLFDGGIHTIYSFSVVFFLHRYSFSVRYIHIKQIYDK
jgi:hypothetical protein